MNADAIRQMQQIDRARTFAEIRRIEARISTAVRAKPRPRHRPAWPFGTLLARRRGARTP